MFDIYDFYEKMEDGKIMLSFKGEITGELLTSILHIMESKLDSIGEEPKLRKKVYNVLVECLQNLYHHTDGLAADPKINQRSPLFLIARTDDRTYKIITGNYILNSQVDAFKARIDHVNSLNKQELKEFYYSTLEHEEFSGKGGGGLGLIDIARKSGHAIEYTHTLLDPTYSFVSLLIKITQE